MNTLLALIALIDGAAAVYFYLHERTVVHDYEWGLHYRNGHLERVLEAGAYRLCRLWSSVRLVDRRRSTLNVAGQEVLGSDGVGLKVSLAIHYQVEEPRKAIHEVQDFSNELYIRAQLALRERAAAVSVDDLLEKRADLGRGLVEAVAPEARKFGLLVHSIDVKDIMLPGDLKNTLAQVVKARKEGQAALERARGETAALRSLANAARMLDSNPNLLNLRLLQTLENPSGLRGNTIVLGMPQGLVPPGSGGGKPGGAAADESAD